MDLKIIQDSCGISLKKAPAHTKNIKALCSTHKFVLLKEIRVPLQISEIEQTQSKAEKPNLL